MPSCTKTSSCGFSVEVSEETTLIELPPRAGYHGQLPQRAYFHHPSIDSILTERQRSLTGSMAVLGDTLMRDKFQPAPNDLLQALRVCSRGRIDSNAV